jgi:chemosensory pili system protein ChpA (sensor histidine kinase/response regulator)
VKGRWIELIPSLEHILRNAIDHGIEPIEDRRRLGKPEMGNIEVTFTRKGSMAAIEIKDDGAGINTDAVRKKAIKIGLLAPNAVVNDEEVVRFILEPGFSTREAVTEISGRGVGMDVVNTAIKEMGGSLSIISEPGQGSRMTVRFPFTTSLNRVLLFKIGKGSQEFLSKQWSNCWRIKNLF